MIKRTRIYFVGGSIAAAVALGLIVIQKKGKHENELERHPKSVIEPSDPFRVPQQRENRRDAA